MLFCRFDSLAGRLALLSSVVCNVYFCTCVLLAGGRASVEESVSLGRFLRDFQGHVVPRSAHGAAECSRDRRIQSMFTLGWETGQSTQSCIDASQQTSGQIIISRSAQVRVIWACLFSEELKQARYLTFACSILINSYWHRSAFARDRGCKYNAARCIEFSDRCLVTHCAWFISQQWALTSLRRSSFQRDCWTSTRRTPCFGHCSVPRPTQVAARVEARRRSRYRRPRKRRRRSHGTRGTL